MILVINYLNWKLIWKCIPIRSTLATYFSLSEDQNSLCPLCSSSPETYEHRFLSCHFARIIWRLSSRPLDTLSFEGLSISNWIKFIYNGTLFFNQYGGQFQTPFPTFCLYYT
jgi:hypothetical protein